MIKLWPVVAEHSSDHQPRTVALTSASTSNCDLLDDRLLKPAHLAGPMPNTMLEGVHSQMVLLPASGRVLKLLGMTEELVIPLSNQRVNYASHLYASSLELLDALRRRNYVFR